MTLLTLQERTNTKPKQLRREGIVPIGLVERGKPTRMVQATAAAVKSALTHTTGARMLEVKIEGESKTWTVMVKQVDHEVITGRILTVTLAEVSKTEAIVADVPVTHTGTPRAVADGQALLGHPTTHLKLKGKAMDLPASVDVDVSGLQVGEHVNAGDVELPKGVELVSSPDATLFSVQITRAHVEDGAPEAAEAAASEPEAQAEPVEEAAPEEA